MRWSVIIAASMLLAACATSGCATSGGGGAAKVTTMDDRESSQSSGVWRRPTSEATDKALVPIEKACNIRGNNGYEAGACAREKLLVLWPDTAPGHAACEGTIGVRPMAVCLIDFGYWSGIAQKLSAPSPMALMGGNWATFNLQENEIFRFWFVKTQQGCNPAGTTPEANVLACTRAEARKFLGVNEEALQGCPSRADPAGAVLCYWDAAFNRYVLGQLPRLGA